MPTTTNLSLTSGVYPIVLGDNLSIVISKKISSLQKQGSNLVVITDSNVKRKQAAFIEKTLKNIPLLAVKPGESSKSAATLEKIYTFLTRHKIDRQSYIIALGGGVVGDLAGFAAATFLRGIRFIQIPTTLLAMVDSSVGGKTGINLKEGKNLVGAFHQPAAVYISINTLETLPQREFNAGMAEVLKSGLLGDRVLWNLLTKETIVRTSPKFPLVIKKTFCLKAKLVAADEKEVLGERALLNLGHTFGHAIENCAGYGNYLHGEAVSIGIRLAAELSCELGYLSQKTVALIKETLSSYKLPICLKKSLPIAKLNRAMRLDKKSEKGNIGFVLIKKEGEAFLKNNIPATLISNIWKRAMPAK